MISFHARINSSDFIRELQQLKDKSIAKKSETLIQKMMQDLMPDVIERTPRETGLARSAWSEGFQSLLESESESVSFSTEKSEQSSNNLHSSHIDRKPDEITYSVTNGVSYINFLEFGTQKMPPRRMVHKSLSALQNEQISLLD